MFFFVFYYLFSRSVVTLISVLQSWRCWTCFDKHLFFFLVIQPISVCPGWAHSYVSFPFYSFFAQHQYHSITICVYAEWFLYASLYLIRLPIEISDFFLLLFFTFPKKAFSQSNLPNEFHRITVHVRVYQNRFLLRQTMNAIEKKSLALARPSVQSNPNTAHIFYLSIYLRWWMSTVLSLFFRRFCELFHLIRVHWISVSISWNFLACVCARNCHPVYISCAGASFFWWKSFFFVCRVGLFIPKCHQYWYRSRINLHCVRIWIIAIQQPNCYG